MAQVEPAASPPVDTAPVHRGPARTIATAALLIGAAAVVVGAFLPWVVSGEVSRDSFATVRAAQLVGVVDRPVWQAVLSVWFFAPLAAAVVLVGLALQRRRLVPAVAIGLGLASALLAGLVLLAPVDRGAGPVLVLIGSIALLIGAALWLAAGRRPSRPQRAAAA
jgi:hypothetical protein